MEGFSSIWHQGEKLFADRRPLKLGLLVALIAKLALERRQICKHSRPGKLEGAFQARLSRFHGSHPEARAKI